VKEGISNVDVDVNVLSTVSLDCRLLDIRPLTERCLMTSKNFYRETLLGLKRCLFWSLLRFVCAFVLL